MTRDRSLVSSGSSSYSAPATCDTTWRTGRVLWDDRQPRCLKAHCQPVYVCLLVHFIPSGTVDRVAPAVAIQKVLLCPLHLKAPRFSPIFLHSLPPPLSSTCLFGHPRSLYHTSSIRVANQDVAFSGSDTSIHNAPIISCIPTYTLNYLIHPTIYIYLMKVNPNKSQTDRQTVPSRGLQLL